MLRGKLQKTILGDGLTPQDAVLGHEADLSNQLSAATGPSLRGTAASDRLKGSNDDDLIQGLAGNDTLIGRRGADRLLGQAGDDSLNGGGGEDTLFGGTGNDRMKGGGGSDSLKGGGGDDTLLGGGGADTLKGGGGEDSLNGGGGSDLLAGGGKSDTLDGSRGDDTLKGGGGDDLILGGVGSDRIVGGGGADMIRYRDADFARGAVDVIVGFKTGEDKIDLSAVTIPAGGLEFALIDGSIALEISGGRLVFQGIANPALLSAEDFVLPSGVAPISFALPVTPLPEAENRAPTVSAVVEGGAPETDPAYTVDLLAGASDPDEDDLLSVSDLSLISGDASGINFTGAALEVDPAAYQRLAAGEAEVITYAYAISDQAGASVAQTATVTIFGVNDAPMTAGPVVAAASEDDAGFVVDLLAGATDPDAMTVLSIEGLTLVSGSDRGVVIAGAGLDVDPSAYNDHSAGDVETIVYRYEVTDGAGGVATQTATVTINGSNDAPTVVAEVRGGGSAGGETFTVNLLDGARDVDAGDSLTISALRVISGNASGIRESSDSLIVDPSAYAGLNGGQDEEIVYAYDIVDGSGTTVEQTATITIVGANDAPSVAAQLRAEASEDDASFTLDLLQSASDPDAGDVLSVANITLVSGDPAGVDLAGARLEVDPGAYNRLSAGDEETIVFRYDVTDGKGGTAAQFATIAITGVNDAPAASSELREGGSESGGDFTINLLEGAEDPDEGDVLGVQGVTLVSGDGSGVTLGASSLSVDVSAYTSLGFGDVETIRYTYQVSDNAGGSVLRAAEITVFGENSAPVASGPVTAIANELDASSTLELLQGASDPDRGDAVSIANLRLTNGDDAGVAAVGGSLFINPALYRTLITGEQEVISYTYDLVDGNGGVTPQTAEVTIEGGDAFRTVSGSDLGNAMSGTPERDEIFGLGGGDTIVGGAGDDLIFGGTGNDVIETSVGEDRLTGGAGQDEFVIRFADEDNKLLDATPDIITDFDPLLDKLDFRKVIGADENFADLVTITKDDVLNRTTIDILGTDVVILEGISQTFQQYLDNGNLAFDTANFHFLGNDFGLANLTFVGGPITTILLPDLEEGEFYRLNSSVGGGEITFNGEGITLNPVNLDLEPGLGGIVSASVSHFDRFGVEAITEVSWEVLADDQPPIFSGEVFTIFEEATDFRWDLTDFVVDDFFTFGSFNSPTLRFDIVTEPEFGNIVLNSNGETFTVNDGSAIVSENEAVTAIFTLGDDFPEVLEDEFVSVDIEFVVLDDSSDFVFATFTIEIQDASNVLVIDSGPLANEFHFDGDVDTFEVQLEQGVEYAFEARGSGTPAEPTLKLLDDNFIFIDQGQTSGEDETSLISFTAHRTGLFILQVEAVNAVSGGYFVEALQIDDFGETFANARQTTIGQSVFGQLEIPGDLDGVSIFLDQGVSYQFDLLGEPSGVGTLSDPLLRLQNKDGEELAFNDDRFGPDNITVSLESQIFFTPEVSDTYLLVADSFGSQFTGTWEISTVELL